jgi:hypothetical protein
MSRSLYPKQFLPLVTSATLPRETAAAAPVAALKFNGRDTGELHIVEIQSGATLNENGIKRFEDVYGRI